MANARARRKPGQRRVSADAPGEPSVSVVVPVRDDRDGLRRCLAALGRQRLAPPFEIVVADDGSRPEQDPAPVVAAARGARLVREPARGSYAARNAALGAARGTVVAFTDADAEPEPEWLARGIAALEADPCVGLVAGRIASFVPDGAPLDAVALLERVSAFPQHEYAAAGYGATANVLTRRAVLDGVGLFDASLPSGGDREWGARVRAAGWRVAYAPDAVVRHPVRGSRAALLAKARRVVAADHALARRDARGRWRWRANLVRKALPPLGRLLALLRADAPLYVRASACLLAERIALAQLAERWRLTLGAAPRW